MGHTGASPFGVHSGLAINPPHGASGVAAAGTDMVTVQHPGRGFLANDGTYQASKFCSFFVFCVGGDDVHIVCHVK